MYKNFLAPALGVLLSLAAIPATAQPTQVWNSPLAYRKNNGDKTVVDAQGDIFVAAAASDGAKSPSVIKFLPNGQVAWIGYGPLEPSGDCVGIKLTPDGGVLAGFHHNVHEGRTDSTIQKFGPNGALQRYKYNTSFLQSFDVDSNGYFYGSYESFLIKRKPNAQTVWTVSPLHANESFSKVVADGQGGMYASVYNSHPYPGTFQMLHADANGSANEVAAPPVSAMKMKGDFIYGHGTYAYLENTFHLKYLAAIFKMDRNMNVVWSVPIDAAGGDELNVVTVDSQSNVIVAGDHIIGGGVVPGLVIKYDTNGNLVYRKTFSGAANSLDSAVDLTTNANGDAFVLMELTMQKGLLNDLHDIGIVRYDSSGNTVWPSSGGLFFNGAIIYNSGFTDYGSGVGLDSAGNVLIAGAIWDLSAGGSFFVFASKYTDPHENSAFNFQWVPTTMVAGHTYTVTVGFQNSGNTTWTMGDGYGLESMNPSGNMTWGLNSVPVTVGFPVTPGGSKGFSFTVTAPSTHGHYNFQWQVAKNGIGFGAMSPDLSINVTP